MSDFLLPKSSPRLTQETLEKTLVVLRQPFSLAVIASITVHGIIWAVAPLLPAGQSPEVDTSRQVSVVELSPNEQLRLPDFANPQITFPPLSAPSQQPITKAAPTPSAQSPSSPAFNDPLYNFPIIQPPPAVVWPSLDLPTIFDPPKRVVTRTVTPPTKEPPKKVEPDKTNSPNSTQSPTPTETQSPTAEASPPAQVRPDKIPPAALQRLEELQKQYRQERLAQQPNQSGSPTTQSEAFAKINPWVMQIAETEKVAPEVLWQAFTKPKKDNLVVACPGNCAEKVAKLPATPSFVVFVDPKGKIIKPPVQVTTGDKDLDQAALDQLQKFEATIPATGNYQTYQLRVQFEESKKAEDSKS